MQIHRIRGRDLRDALVRAKAMLGEQALVLNHESTPSGHVTVAVSRPSADAETASPPERGRSDVVRRIAATGASESLQREVEYSIVEQDARGAFAIDAAARYLSTRVPIAASPKVGSKTRVIAFVGPTGVGKTTTLAKLAVHLVRARRRVALVTMDTYRVGAYDQLAAYGELLQAQTRVARSGAELRQIVAESRNCHALLLDTTGRSPADSRALAELSRALHEGLDGPAHAVLDPHLVLPATASAEALEEAIEGFAPTRPTAAVITKIDETNIVAPALERCATVQLPVAFFCDGQDVSKHLHRASPDACADLFLRGRLS